MTAVELVVHAAGACVFGCDHAPVEPQQVEVCRGWLVEHAKPRKTINRVTHSGFLKGSVEVWSETLGVRWEQADRHGRRFDGPRLYIANGAFIAAALAEGYRVQTAPGRPEVTLAISFLGYWGDDVRWRRRAPGEPARDRSPRSAPALSDAANAVYVRLDKRR